MRLKSIISVLAIASALGVTAAKADTADTYAFWRQERQVAAYYGYAPRPQLHEHIWRHARHTFRRFDQGVEPVVRGIGEAIEGAGSSLLSIAARFVGHGNPTGFRGPWCKAFVNMVRARAGKPYGHSLRAVDTLREGHRVSNPRPGDLVVYRHHVTIFAGFKNGRIVGLGGNQGRGGVNYSTRSAGGILGFVRM